MFDWFINIRTFDKLIDNFLSSIMTPFAIDVAHQDSLSLVWFLFRQSNSMVGHVQQSQIMTEVNLFFNHVERVF